MHSMHTIALVGTSAMVTVGYCSLERMLELAWFNRTQPLTLSLVRSVIYSPPESAIFYHRTTPICSCSMAEAEFRIVEEATEVLISALR